MIIGLAFLAGLFAPATEIGVRLLTQRLVSDGELEQANGLISMAQQLSILFGPALAGWITATWGAPIAMFVDGLSFLALVIVLPTLRLPTTIAAAHDKPRQGFMNGFRQLYALKPVRMLTLLLFMLALSYFPLEPALPLYVERVIRADAAAYGLIWSSFGVGAALSFLLIAPLSLASRPGVVAALIAIGWGIAILPAAIAPSLTLAIASFALGGLSWGPYAPLETTLLLRLIPRDQQGAVFGARSALINLTGPVGVMLGSGLLQIVSANTVLALSSAAVLIAGVVALLSSDLRALRKTEVRAD